MRLLSTMTPPQLRLTRRRRTAIVKNGVTYIEEITTTLELRIPAALVEIKRRMLAWLEPELCFNPAMG